MATTASATRYKPLVETGWRVALLRLGNLLLPFVNVAVFLALWQWVQGPGGLAPIVRPEWIPAPTTIAESWSRWVFTGKLTPHLKFSLINLFAGIGISALLGVPLGMLFGGSKTLRGASGPWLWALASLPIIAIQPIVILILGFGHASKIFIITLFAIFPVIINAQDGVATVDQAMLKAARTFGANRLQVFTKIVVPSTVPWLIQGMRLASNRAKVAMIISEIWGSKAGLGFIIVRSMELSDTATIFATLTWVVAIAVLIVGFWNWLEGRLAHWRPALAV